MSPSRADVRDRRAAACHEAGHLIVAAHLGLDITEARIWRGTPTRWHGEVCWRGEELTADQLRLLGCAGAVGEAAWTMRMHPGHGHDWSLNMSEADWAGSGCEPGAPDEEVFRAAIQAWNMLAGDLWWPLCKIARQLIVNARTGEPWITLPPIPK